MTEHTKATNELKAQSQETNNQLQKLSSRVDALAAQNRIIESQFAQHASGAHNRDGKLPSQLENPREHVKAVMLRSGRPYEGPRMLEETETESLSWPTTKEEGVTMETENVTVNDRENSESQPKEKPTVQEPKYIPPPPYKPPIPFSQRLVKYKQDQQFAKFVEVLQKLQISIPFHEAIMQIPRMPST